MINKADMDLLPTLMPFNNTESIPFTFTCGGTVVCGIDKVWFPTVTTRRIDANITETIVTAITPNKLEIRWECKTYSDFPAVEYVAYITNLAESDSPIIENLRISGEIAGKSAILYHGNGDTCREDGYEWWKTPINTNKLSLFPCGDGTSCNGAFPYMRLLFADHGVNLAVGWTGTWIADFSETETGISVSVGQKRCHMVIHPGETIRTPSLTMLAYNGNEDRGRNIWRRWYISHILPKQEGKPLAPKCCMHLFEAGGKPEFTGATEKNQIDAIDAYLEKGIHPDVWWIDAGWYPCNFNWKMIGSWHPNPAHFSNGLTPIGDKCRETGMEFLLWFEPERAWKDSDIDRTHPEWMLHWHKSGEDQMNRVVDLGNKACCDYIIDLIDGIIKKSGVTIYRQDYNFDPGPYWEEAETENRIGAVENLAIQGYYRFWDTLLIRNPGLLIDSCASGGRRNDLETMRRSVPFHYTDVGYGNHPIKLKQHRQMYEWIPYFRAHNMNWCAQDGTYDNIGRMPDRYSFYAAMAPALTDMTRYDADEQGYELAREMQPIWRKAAKAMLSGDYYPLTECRKSAEDFYAAEFFDPKTETGILHLVNGSTASKTQHNVAMKALDEKAEYTLTSSASKKHLTLSGETLMKGFLVTQKKHTGDVWFIERRK